MSRKDDILKAAACPEGEAEIAGHKVRIRGMTTAEELKYLRGGDDEPVDGLGICAACILDDKGKPLFTEAELGGIKAASLGLVLREIMALSSPVQGVEEKNS